MKSEWQDAGKLADFYRYFGKRLELRGYWMLFGYAVAFVRARPTPDLKETKE